MGIGYFLLGTAAGVGVGYVMWARAKEPVSTLLITAPTPPMAPTASTVPAPAQLPAPTTQGAVMGGFAPTTGGRQVVVEEPVVGGPIVSNSAVLLANAPAAATINDIAHVPGTLRPTSTLGDFGMLDPQWLFKLNPYVFRPQVTVRTFTSPEYGAKLQYNSTDDQNELQNRFGARPGARSIWMRGDPNGTAALALVSPTATRFYQTTNRAEAENVFDLLVRIARSEMYADASNNGNRVAILDDTIRGSNALGEVYRGYQYKVR